MNRYPTAIIWDLDGTLIDSAPDLAWALNTLLCSRGYLPIEEDRVRTMIGDGVAKLVSRGFSAAGAAVAAPRLQPLVAQFMRIYLDCATEKTQLYPSARSVLQHFHDAGIAQGICTNKPEEVTTKILTNLAVVRYFSVIVGGDTTAAKKPDPLPLRACLTALKANSQMSVMIGDSAVDVATARAVGMRVGIVRHGYARSTVASLGADFLIDNLSVVPELVGPARKTG